MQKIPPEHKDLLLKRIHEGRCVPVLGAGANVACKERGYDGLPLASGVARKLAHRIQLKDTDISDLDLSLDLAKIALEFEFDTDRTFLIETLKSIIPDQERQPSPLLRMLARLPFRLIITTNYDRLMEKALDEINNPYKLFVQPTYRSSASDWKSALRELANYEGLILHKLHGSFFGDDSSAESNSLIITEDDYISFLATMNEGQGIPKTILSRIVDSTLLFLGYSIKDWDFRLIYRNLPSRSQLKAFVVLRDDPSTFWLRYLHMAGFEIYNMDIYEFAEELEQGYLSKYGDNAQA